MHTYFGTSYDQILQDEENSSMISNHCPQDDNTTNMEEEE